MKVYILDQNNKLAYLKVFRKKISYEGLHDRYRKTLRYLNKTQRKELKRVKKAAFSKHISPMSHAKK